MLSKRFEVCRWTYNQCASAINDETVNAIKKRHMRAAFINKTNFESKNQWVKEVPYNIRDEAMNDTLKSLQASKAKKLVNQ